MPKPNRPPDSTDGFSVELCDGQVLFDLGASRVLMPLDQAQALAAQLFGMIASVKGLSGFVVVVSDEDVTVKPISRDERKGSMLSGDFVNTSRPHPKHEGEES